MSFPTAAETRWAEGGGYDKCAVFDCMNVGRVHLLGAGRNVLAMICTGHSAILGDVDEFNAGTYFDWVPVRTTPGALEGWLLLGGFSTPVELYPPESKVVELLAEFARWEAR